MKNMDNLIKKQEKIISNLIKNKGDGAQLKIEGEKMLRLLGIEFEEFDVFVEKYAKDFHSKTKPEVIAENFIDYDEYYDTFKSSFDPNCTGYELKYESSNFNIYKLLCVESLNEDYSISGEVEDFIFRSFIIIAQEYTAKGSKDAFHLGFMSIEERVDEEK